MVARKYLGVWAVLVLLALPLAFVGAQADVISQWASAAVATSEFSPTDWSAQQATGSPDTRECADLPTAWASQSATGRDALTVFFDQPVFATQVNIYQSYNPGAITRVDYVLADGSGFLTINNSADPGTPCPGVMTIDTERTKDAVFGVRLYLDQSLTGNWNEIDAVQLVGAIAEGVTPVAITTIAPPDDGAAAAAQPTPATPPTAAPTTIPDPNRVSAGRAVTCESGVQFTNGVGVTVVQMRSGFNYTATAIGLNGFDPVLAVLGEDGSGLCEDDTVAAATYSANLPSTGQVAPATVNAQVPFANTSASPFANIDLVVGGFNNATGEFLLVLEGMTFSSADGAGDGFAVEVTESLAAAGVLNAYVISVTNAYDPTVRLVDADYNGLVDGNNNPIGCDDAGNATLCWGESFPLGNSYISRSGGRQLGGGPLDAMLAIPVTQGDIGGFYNFLVNSAQNSFGDYVMVFHMGIG